MNKTAHSALSMGGRIERNLPFQAKVKFQALQDEAEAIRAKLHSAYERAQNARRHADAAAVEWNRIQTHYEPRSVPAAERKLHEAAIEQSRASYDEAHVRSEKMATECALGMASFQHLNAWLDEHQGSTFASVPMPEAKRVGKETWAGGIKRIREQIAALKARLDAAVSAPLPSEMAKELAVRQVTELAAKGKPDVSPLFKGRPALLAGERTWSTDHELDPRHLLAWVAPDLILAQLVAQIDAEADDEKALTPEQKATEVERLGGELLALEREEEAFIEASAAEHALIPRRADADPRAILSLASNIPGYQA